MLSALGISISIATIIIVTGVPASSSRALAEELTRLGTDVIQVAPMSSEQTPVLLPPESVAMVSRIGPVTVASAVANTHATVARSDRIPDEESSGYTVLAGKTNLLEAINAQLHSGHFLTASTEKLRPSCSVPAPPPAWVSPIWSPAGRLRRSTSTTTGSP